MSDSSRYRDTFELIYIPLSGCISELKTWAASEEGARGMQTLESRESKATQLSERFLCQQLDALPASPATSELRRRVCVCIDRLVGGSVELPSLRLGNSKVACYVCVISVVWCDCGAVDEAA